MGLNDLTVKTNAKMVEESLEKNKAEEELEPLSPGSEVHFNHGERSVCILAVFESEKPIDVTAVCGFLKDGMSLTSPRFSSVMVVDNKGKKMWKRVHVNIQDHIKIPICPDGLSPDQYSQHYYDEYVSKLSKEEVPLDKPLWECHIFKYPISHAVHGVIILKFHHAIADGVSLMGAPFTCFRRADDPSLPLSFPSSIPKDQKKQNDDHNELSFVKIYSMVSKLISSIFYFFYDIWKASNKMFVKDDRTPIRSGNPPRSIKVSTVALSLEDAKKIKTCLGVTVNDVVMGTIFLGIQLYMREKNFGSRKSQSTALVMVNARTTKGYAHAQEMHNSNTKVPWGNKAVIFPLTFPNYKQDALEENPLNFVIEPHKNFKRIKTSLGQILVTLLVISTGPKGAARLCHVIENNSSLLVSNMIGPTEKMSLANHPINSLYFMLVGLDMSLAVTIMSYMQKIQLGFGADEDFIDRQKLTKCVENAFNMILQAVVARDGHEPSRAEHCEV